MKDKVFESLFKHLLSHHHTSYKLLSLDAMKITLPIYRTLCGLWTTESVCGAPSTQKNARIANYRQFPSQL